MTKREKLLVDALRAVLEPNGRNSVYADAADVLAMIEAAEGAKPAKGQQPGEAFYLARIAACEAAHAADPRWHLREDRLYCTIPSKLASFVHTRADGSTCKVTMLRDMPLPPAHYWPGGMLPAGVLVAREGPRETRPVEKASPGYYPVRRAA